MKQELFDAIQNLLATIAKLQDTDIPEESLAEACEAVREADDTLDNFIFDLED